MSCQNNVGSIPSVDYHNYDFASHHHPPLESDGGDGRHSPIDTYCGEPQPDKDVLLGHGTESAPESKKKHQMAMKEQIVALEQVLMQEPVQVAAEQNHLGQARAGGAGAEQAASKQGRET